MRSAAKHCHKIQQNVFCFCFFYLECFIFLFKSFPPHNHISNFHHIVYFWAAEQFFEYLPKHCALVEFAEGTKSLSEAEICLQLRVLLRLVLLLCGLGHVNTWHCDSNDIVKYSTFVCAWCSQVPQNAFHLKLKSGNSGGQRPKL